MKAVAGRMMIVDASVALKWCFADEATPYSHTILQRLFNGSALVPALWPYEVTNILMLALRKQRVTLPQIRVFLAELRTLRIDIAVMEPREMGTLWQLAVEAGLTAYDAAYLQLALKTNHPLATADHRLLTAAQRYGVTVC